ncbi:MAG: type II secretion system protein [Phycisphaerales bacterium]|nr:type II secretion system protein [Phycisphaerales bacterium]
MNRTSARRILRTAGFSLVELLVIIAIMGILAAAGIPAIRNMIYTSTGSMAESQLRFGLGAARDLAIRNEGGDTAAVFTFEPGGRMTVIPMVFVGRILDTADPRFAVSTPPAGPVTYRDVFAPTALAEPMQLPAGWMVRGFAPPGSIFAPGTNNSGTLVPSNGWYYENTPVGNRRINLGNDAISGQANKGNWVFPENGFFNPVETNTGENRRNTFMVRFQGGSGRIAGASVTPAIVLLPRNTIDWTAPLTARPTLSTTLTQGDWRRIDHADNLPNWARSVTKLPLNSDIASLIGCRSVDVAMACNVNLLALYDERKMAQTIGARGVNKLTGTIYGGAVPPLNTAAEFPKAPNIDLSLWPSSSLASANAERVQMLINSYMLNALKYSDVDTGGPNTNLDADARLFRMDTYLGSAVETR